jgi:hypothetical protein
MTEYAESKPAYQHPIAVDEMWSLTNKEEKNWGIEGYEIHKNYYDCAKEIYLKKRNLKNEMVWAKRDKFLPVPPKKDKDGKDIIPHRPNYLDEVIKLANSFYNKEKGEKLKEELKDKGFKPLPIKVIPVVGRAARELFTDTMIKQQKKNNLPNKDKDLTVINEKTAKYEKEKKSKSDALKAKYSGAVKGTSQCDRVNMTSEAIYVGEQIPFYNTAPLKEGAEDRYEDAPGGNLQKDQVPANATKERKTKKNKVIFFPRKFFTSAWGKAPAWVYPKKFEKNPKFDYNKIEEALKEKREKVMENLKKIPNTRVAIDVPQSWFEVNYHCRIYLKFALPVKKELQYHEWKKINPPKHPGPNQYWMRDPVKYVSGKSKPVEAKKVEQEEGKDKVYVLENKYSGNKYYKPMKGHIF